MLVYSGFVFFFVEKTKIKFKKKLVSHLSKPRPPGYMHRYLQTV